MLSIYREIDKNYLVVVAYVLLIVGLGVFFSVLDSIRFIISSIIKRDLDLGV